MCDCHAQKMYKYMRLESFVVGYFYITTVYSNVVSWRIVFLVTTDVSLIPLEFCIFLTVFNVVLLFFPL